LLQWLHAKTCFQNMASLKDNEFLNKECWQDRKISTIRLHIPTSFSSAAFVSSRFNSLFLETSYLMVEVNCTEPSLSVSIPCCCHSLTDKVTFYRFNLFVFVSPPTWCLFYVQSRECSVFLLKKTELILNEPFRSFIGVQCPMQDYVAILYCRIVCQWFHSLLFPGKNYLAIILLIILKCEFYFFLAKQFCKFL